MFHSIKASLWQVVDLIRNFFAQKFCLQMIWSVNDGQCLLFGLLLVSICAVRTFSNLTLLKSPRNNMTRSFYAIFSQSDNLNFAPADKSLQSVANAMKAVQAGIYKSVNTGTFLKSLVARSIVKFSICLTSHQIPKYLSCQT